MYINFIHGLNKFKNTCREIFSARRNYQHKANHSWEDEAGANQRNKGQHAACHNKAQSQCSNVACDCLCQVPVGFAFNIQRQPDFDS